MITDSLSIAILREYISKFPKDVQEGQFLRKMNDSLIPSKQPIGKNKMASFPTAIATFLELHEPDKFTSHAFRRSSASFLSNSGASAEQIKQAGGCKSSTVAERYIEESTSSKLEISKRLKIGYYSSEKIGLNDEENSNMVKSSTSSSSGTVNVTGLHFCPTITISDSTNCTINLHVEKENLKKRSRDEANTEAGTEEDM